jgi:DNA-binding winged helix-turn-helix (wHTH) protein/tetratricopeptide (TPR) repeat protein
MAFPIYHFGEFRLDPATRVLTRGDAVIALPSKAFDCIVYLIEHRERAIGRDELIAAVWGKADIGDNVLGQTVLFARRALEDTGKEQHAIRTIVRHGYHWVAPVRIETTALAASPEKPATATELPSAVTVDATTAEIETVRDRPVRRRHLPIALAVIAVVLAATGIAFWRGPIQQHSVSTETTPTAQTNALVLPAIVTGDAESAWARLGVMDLVANRLRAAGLTVVPSDNVVVLARGLDPATWQRGDIETLVKAATASLVIDAQAEALAGRWRVSLRTVFGREPPIDVQAESLDLLAASRAAADRLAARLGGAAGAVDVRPLDEPAFAALLQQVDVAMLSDRLDTALNLLESASTGQRQRPEVRFRLAQIDYQAGRFDVAAAAFTGIAASVSAEQDAVMHARALHSLGIIAMQRNDPEAALPRFDAAIKLLEGRNVPGILGKALNSRAGCHATRHEYAAALADFADARVALESAGDGLALAVLDANIGAFDMLRDRYADAVSALDRAIGRFATFRLHAAELNARDAAAQAHLVLLEPGSALAFETRLRELASQVADPQRRLGAELTRVEILVANGRLHDAQALLGQIRDDPAGTDATRGRAAAIDAGFALDAHDAVDAARLASTALAKLPDNDDVRLAIRTRLVLLRAQIADRTATTANSAAIDAWAQRVATPSARAIASLAAAELVASGGGDAASLFERALADADEGRVPLDVLLVAQAYAGRLLASREPGRAGGVAERIARWAEQDYAAALLQLQIHHALGQTAAWRSALARCQQLAGERVIPAALLVAP